MGDLQPLTGRAGLSAEADCRGGGGEEDAVLYLGAWVFLRGRVRAAEGRREGVRLILNISNLFSMLEVWNFFWGLLTIILLILCMLSIGKALMFTIYSIQWFFKEFLAINMFYCILSDLNNCLNFLLVLFILIIGGIISKMAISILYIGYFPEGALNDILLVVVIFSFPLIIFHFLRIKMYNDSLLSINREPCSENYTANSRHQAIIIVRYAEKRSNYFVSDCIRLLIEGFRKKNITYNSYVCQKKEDFIDIYQNNKAIGLWVFGHGAYSHLYFDEGYLFYRDLPNNTERKDFIGQFHCNPCKGVSLIEKNHPKSYFISHYMRIAMQNRCYILNRFREDN